VHMGEIRSWYTILVEKPEGQWPLGQPRHRRNDIKCTLGNGVGGCGFDSCGSGY
jgi:hypothetical protein